MTYQLTHLVQYLQALEYLFHPSQRCEIYQLTHLQLLVQHLQAMERYLQNLEHLLQHLQDMANLLQIYFQGYLLQDLPHLLQQLLLAHGPLPPPQRRHL